MVAGVPRLGRHRGRRPAHRRSWSASCRWPASASGGCGPATTSPHWPAAPAAAPPSGRHAGATPGETANRRLRRPDPGDLPRRTGLADGPLTRRARLTEGHRRIPDARARRRDRVSQERGAPSPDRTVVGPVRPVPTPTTDGLIHVRSADAARHHPGTAVAVPWVGVDQHIRTSSRDPRGPAEEWMAAGDREYRRFHRMLWTAQAFSCRNSAASSSRSHSSSTLNGTLLPSGLAQ